MLDVPNFLSFGRELSASERESSASPEPCSSPPSPPTPKSASFLTPPTCSLLPAALPRHSAALASVSHLTLRREMPEKRELARKVPSLPPPVAAKAPSTVTYPLPPSPHAPHPSPRPTHLALVVEKVEHTCGRSERLLRAILLESEKLEG